MTSKIDELRKRENEIQDELSALMKEKSKVSLEMQRKCSLDFVEAMYKFCGNFTSGKVLKDFAAANDALAVLSATSPGAGYLGYMESADIWDGDSRKAAQMKFMTGYVLSSVWVPGAEFWRVLARIAETIANPDNPFGKEGAA